MNGNTDRVEAISGDTSQWEELFSVVDSNISVEEKFEFVQQNVDVVNMIDYMLLNFYAGNNDWDHNNFRVGRRIDETGRFQFFTWDAERSDLNALSALGDDMFMDSFEDPIAPKQTNPTAKGCR